MRGYSYVYILVSETYPSRHYTGCAMDLTDRILKHNSGNVPHTTKDSPWRIEAVVRFASKGKARAFEPYPKSGAGREFARRHFLTAGGRKATLAHHDGCSAMYAAIGHQATDEVPDPCSGPLFEGGGVGFLA